MNSRKRFSILWIAALLSACSDSGTNPGSIDYLAASFVGGSIGADLMPVIPPGSDPIRCALDVRLQNTDMANSLRGISIRGADVYHVQSKEKLGAIVLTSDWKGELAPGEIDTIRFLKVDSETASFEAPCNQYVYLEISFGDPGHKTMTITTDSLLFGCVY